MAFIPVPNTARVSLEWSYNLLPVGSVSLYFQQTDFTPADLTTLLDDLAAGWVTDLMAELDDGLIASRLTAWDLRAVDGYRATKSISIAGGKVGGDQVTPAASLVVSFYGDKRGKWNQGRNYVPGLIESELTFNSVLNDTALAIQVAYNTLITAPPTGWIWVIVSRVLDGEPRLVGVTAQVVSAIVRNNTIGFQRRRVKRD